jgi:hypothetical protein
MVPEAAAGIPEDLEHLRRRFEEFRNTRVGRSPLPEALWAAAAELAKRYGVNPTARALRLEYAGLQRHMQAQDQPKPKRKHAVAPPPNFLEFVAPGAKPVTNCVVEVESTQGAKLRLELKAVATTELVSLIRAFVSH